MANRIFEFDLPLSGIARDYYEQPGRGSEDNKIGPVYVYPKGRPGPVVELPEGSAVTWGLHRDCRDSRGNIIRDLKGVPVFTVRRVWLRVVADDAKIAEIKSILRGS